MAIEHEGRYYEKVTDGSGAIGDLIHLTEEMGSSCDVWRFTTDYHASIPDIDELTRSNRRILDEDYDVFTRYREVQALVEKAETLPEPYDTGRYKVALFGGDTELYVNSAGEDYVMLTKYLSKSVCFTDESNAYKLAKSANTYGIGTFSIYKEVASLVRLEDDNA